MMTHMDLEDAAGFAAFHDCIQAVMTELKGTHLKRRILVNNDGDTHIRGHMSSIFNCDI